MSLQTLHDRRRSNVPNTNTAVFLGVTENVLTVARPGNPGVGESIVGVSIEIADLLSSDSINHNVARRICCKSEELSIG